MGKDDLSLYVDGAGVMPRDGGLLRVCLQGDSGSSDWNAINIISLSLFRYRDASR